MSEEEKEAIEELKEFRETGFHTLNLKYNDRVQTTRHIEIIIDTVLNLVEKQNRIIDNAINEVEKVRQYFDDDLQPDFIRILEILKDKKVIDW